MALRDCPECGKKISDKAERCPHCGVDPRKARENVAPERKPVEATTAYGSNEPNNGSGGGKKKLWLILVPLILIGIGIAIWVPVYQHKKAEELARIEQMRQDSIAAVEAELARIEQLRQDSIKAAEDSIKREEEFRVHPSIFKGGNYSAKLEKLGFKLIRHNVHEYEDGPDEEEEIYERVFNNRKITYVFWSDSSSGAHITFEDKGDFDQFVKEMKAIGYRKGANDWPGTYSVPNNWDYAPMTIGKNQRIHISMDY